MTEQPVPPRLHKAYLQSPVWKQKRWERFILDKFACQGCGAEDWPLDCHHLTYERMGQEEMDDLVTLCRDCHQLVESFNWSIKELREFREENEPEPAPELSPYSSLLGLMLLKPVEMYQQFNKWLADLDEERLTQEDFEMGSDAEEYLFEVAAFGHEVTDEVRIIYDRVTERVKGLDLGNDRLIDAMYADVIRLRLRAIEWEIRRLYETHEWEASHRELGDKEKLEYAQLAQAIVTRKRRLDAALRI